KTTPRPPTLPVTPHLLRAELGLRSRRLANRPGADRATEDVEEAVVLPSRADRHPDVRSLEAVGLHRADEDAFPVGRFDDLLARTAGARHVHEDEVALRREWADAGCLEQLAIESLPLAADVRPVPLELVRLADRREA